MGVVFGILVGLAGLIVLGLIAQGIGMMLGFLWAFVQACRGRL